MYGAVARFSPCLQSPEAATDFSASNESVPLQPILEDFLARARTRLTQTPDPAWLDFTLEADGDHVHYPDLKPHLPDPQTLRAAAVLMCVVNDPEPHVILTKRQERLRAHKGQIAFPGGTMDADDPSPAVTALREAEEEIALPPEKVEVIGFGPVYQSLTGYRIVPVVGYLEAPEPLVPHEGEVAEIFTVPLSHVISAASYKEHTALWMGRNRTYPAVPYRDRYIWGITAAIMNRMQRILYEDPHR